jgi:hypothetical protein
MKNHQPYLKWWAAITSFLFLLILIGMKFLKQHEMEVEVSACFLFYGLLSPLVYFFGAKGLQSKTNAAFMTSFYGIFMLKLFLSIGFVMLFLYFSKHVKFSFIAAFGIMYFTYSAIETISFIKLSKKKN